MGNCAYNYNGQEYATKNLLAEAIEKERREANGFSSFSVKGDVEELELQEETLRLQAKAIYGTDEHLTFEYNDNEMNVVVDEEATKGFNNGEVLLKNIETGEMESVDVNEIDASKYLNAKEEKAIQIFNDINKSIIEEDIPRVLNEMKGSEDLKQKLISFAEKLGIKFETLEAYLKSKIEREQLEEIDDVKALADIFEKTIALSEDATLEDLVEEVAHFAIEGKLGETLTEKMLERVNETQEYKENAKSYREKYKGDERKVRVEVLGKVLGNAVKNKFETNENNTLAEKGIISQLQELWNSFINMFKDVSFMEEFGSVLDSIATDVLEGNTQGINIGDSKQIYFSINAQGGVQRNIQESLDGIISGLQAQYKSIKNNSPLQKQRIEQQFNEIKERMASATYGKALNAAVHLISGDVQRVERMLEKSKGALEEELKQSDIIELSVFIKNIESTLSSLIVSADLIGKDNYFSQVATENKAMTAGLIKEIQNVKTRASKVIDELAPAIGQRAVNMGEEFIKEKNITDETAISGIRNAFGSGLHEEIGSVGKMIYSFSNVGNYVFKYINVLFAKVNTIVSIANKSYKDGVAEILKRNDIENSPHIKTLLKYGKMLNPFDLQKVEEYINNQIEQIEKEYDEKIEKATTEAEKDSLRAAKKNAIREKRLSYQTKRTTSDHEDNMDKLNLSDETRQNIRDRSNAKFKIFNKYANKDGTINYNAITNKDLIELEAIDSLYKYNLSEWEDNGERKEGSLLTLALELKKYRDGFINQEEQFAVDKFEKEKENFLVNLMQKGMSRTEAFKTKEFAFWARNNARYDYDPAIRAKLDEQSSSVKSVSLKGGYDETNLLNETDMWGVDLENATQQQLLEIYEKLTEKRKQLIAPYKVNGEVDTRMLYKNETLVDSIDHLNNLISSFKVEMGVEEQGKEYNINTRGNKYFYERLAELEHSPREKNAFLKATGAIRDNNNSTVNNVVWIPTLYQYKSYYLTDVNGSEVGKKYIPNYKYSLKSNATTELNPNFIPELAGKTIQYDLNHKELQQFILQEDFYNLFGIDRKNDPYGLKNGATKNKGIWELRQYFLDKKYEIDSKDYGEAYRYFELPQVMLSEKEIMDKGWKATLTAVKESSFMDVSGNEESSVGSSERIVIPKRYNRPLAKQETLTSDIGRMYGEFYSHGVRYREQNKILPDVLTLVDRIKTGNLSNGAEMGQSNLYKMLKNHLSANLYGNLVNEADVLTNILHKIPGVSNRVSGAKLLRTLSRYVSKTGLGFSLITPAVAAISSTVDNVKLFMADNMVDRDSAARSLAEAGKLLVEYGADAGNLNPNTRAKKLAEYFPLNISGTELIDGLTKSKMYRVISDPSMKLFEMAGIGSALQAIVAASYAHRLMPDGRFHNINSWREANVGNETEANRQFKEAKDKSYYGYLNTDGGSAKLDIAKIKADGFTGDITKLELEMLDVVERYWAKIENQAVQLDKPQLYLNPYMMFTGIYTQWMFNFIQTRFKSKQYSFETNRWEQGVYGGVFDSFRDIIVDENTPISQKLFNSSKLLGSMVSAGWYAKGMEKLDESQKTSVRQFAVDMYSFALTFAVMVLVNMAADDDDEKDNAMIQYAAYLSTRVLSEQASAAFPFALRDIIKKVKEPVVGMNYIESIANLPLMFNSEGGKEVKRGTYKGMTKRKKALIQMTVMKNMMHPYVGARAWRDSNKFFRSMALSTEGKWYDSITEMNEE